MKAVMITEPGEAEVIDLERPEIKADEVLVRSRVVGICASDVELYQGKRPQGYASYPVIPGHEWSGEVVAVGELVQHIAPGAKVVVESFPFCGVCRNCRNGLTNLCEKGYDELGFTRHGGLAEYVAVPARQVHVLKSDASFEEASLLEPAATVVHAFQRAQPRPNDIVVVVGDEPVCLLAVQMARLFSPAKVILLGFRDERLQLAQQLGATHTINMSREDSLSIVQSLSRGRGADYVFEGSGHVQAVEEALTLARRGGTVLLEGLTASIAPLSVSSDLFVLKHLAVFGVFGANSAAWEYAVQLYNAGVLQLSPLISHRFSLEEYQEAMDTLILRMSRALKVLIVHT
jgi:2-desacetyl-2-hydroxyethyl bacteriochlorophyllide A dehydrogenase